MSTPKTTRTPRRAKTPVAAARASLPAPVAVPEVSEEKRRRRVAKTLDQQYLAAVGKAMNGLSPVSLTLAYTDWAMNMALHPGNAMRLGVLAQQHWLRWMGETLGQSFTDRKDARFAHPGWQQWPLAPIVHAYHAAEDWWADASHLPGMNGHHQEMTRFMSRQMLDMLSPSNNPLLSPEVRERTQERLGTNLFDGWRNRIDRWRLDRGIEPLQDRAHQFIPGQTVAVTPGKVVFRNRLVELIQYAPTTSHVQAEPVFIVPSWIMKYYILDLSPGNSMVKWLTDQGHTVFILSWRNPDESDAGLDMSDYLDMGIYDPLAAIARQIPGQKVHVAGYCLGGTLLSIGVAGMSRPGGVSRSPELPELASLTLMAAELDFSEPGEMGVLIDEAQVNLLKAMMAERGFLTGPQMGGSFAYLHSRELVWSRRMRELYLGEIDAPNDLMAWNADTTRMPAAMHGEYLDRCYLRNEIAEGRFPVEGTPVAISDITLPMFVIGTEKDHVSPWKAVYKIHQLADSEITFILASGGHNAGIVSEPGRPRRYYASRVRPYDGAWESPEAWVGAAERTEGSWWPAWREWMVQKGSGQTVRARSPKAADALYDAPGHNIFQCYADPIR